MPFAWPSTDVYLLKFDKIYFTKTDNYLDLFLTYFLLLAF